MISNYLIVLIAFSALFNTKQSRLSRLSLLCFSLLCAVMVLADMYITQRFHPYYYLLAALTDLFIIIVLSKITKPNGMVLFLQQASLLFICINLFGWITYELYIDPFVYNILCESLFVIILLVSARGIKNGMGNHSIYRNRGFFFGNTSPRACEIQRNEETKRP